MRNSILIPALAVIGTLVLIERTMAQCDEWRAGPLIELAGVNGGVGAATTWDPDGAGPLSAQLVVGGDFPSAGGTSVNGIARWDGTTWMPFGSGFAESAGRAPNVQALAVLSSSYGVMAGQLIAGGSFDSVGGVPATAVARWDGSAWHAMPGLSASGSLQPSLNWLYVVPSNVPSVGGQLIAGGFVELVNGVPINNGVARWDGAAWHSMGSTPADYAVCGMPYAWDPDGASPLPPVLVCSFWEVTGSGGPITVRYWDGTNWAPYLPTPLCQCGPLSPMITMPSGPLAGQLIANANAEVENWDGVSWQHLGPPPFDNSYNIYALSAVPTGNGPFAGQVVIGGYFTNSHNNIARYDGTNWQDVGAGFDGEVRVLTSWDPDGAGSQTPQLVAGGYFANAGSGVVNSIAHFDGNVWRSFSGSVTGATVYSMASIGSRLAVGGSFSFTAPSNYTPNNIATWDGDSIGTLGSGMNGVVFSMKSYTTGLGSSQTSNLVAGGDFITANGTTVNHIALWSETVSGLVTPWRAFGAGFNGTVLTIERFNNLIYAGGTFTKTSDNVTTLNRVAQWNGTAWVPLGTGLNSNCNALKVYNGQLYAGGSFTTAGGLTSTGLARWNGTSWGVVGITTSTGAVNALEVFNGALILAGTFTGVGGSPNIMKYDSVSGTFSPLATGAGGTDGAVNSLLVENGNLYVGGAFTHAGGLAASHLARWNGTAWSDVRGGADNTVLALAPYHDEVHVGGSFSTVRNGSINSRGWARYLETGAPWIARNPPPSVTGTCNGNVSFPARGAAGYSSTAQWRHNGVPVADGPTGTGSTIAGSHNGVLDVRHIGPADAGTYDLVLSNTCGSSTSLASTLTLSGGTGNGDGNGDGVADGQDIAGFVRMLLTGISQGRGLCAYDMNGDGVVNTTDMPAFISRLLN